MAEKAQKRPPGRPHGADVDIEIYCFVRGELEKGRTLSKIGRAGFTVYTQVAPGKFAALRQIKGKHLEAKYRAIEERFRPPFARNLKASVHGRPVYSAGMLPLEAIGGLSPIRRAGRPKNIYPSQF